MKDLIRISIFILIYYLSLMFLTEEIKAQDWPCGNSATYNIGIPNNNSTVYLCENSVAVQPLKPNIILVANNILSGGVSAHVSTNWGVTWLPATDGHFDISSRGDPAAGIDLNGYMYVAYLGGGGMKVARSIDRGTNWTPVNIPNSGGADKDHLHIDNSCESQFKGRLYCAWKYSDYTYFSYSSNSGANWVSAVQLPHAALETAFGVNITSDKAGIVYVVWALHYDISGVWNNLEFVRSTNGGVNWSSVIPIHLQYSGGQGNGINPSMTVDMQDNPTLYLVYSGNTGSPYYNDIFLLKSTNQGQNWSGETMVNQNRTGAQSKPWISCDPATGYLACIYYDTRSGYNTYLSLSSNSGSSWCDMMISSVPADHEDVVNDYIGVEFNKGIVYPVWSDKRDNPDGRIRAYTYPFEVISKDLIVQNQSYYGTHLIQSANTITSVNNTVNTGASVTYRTVNSITLLPGFYTNDNSYFLADLFHCEGYTEPENIPMNYQISNKEEKDNTIPYEFSLFQNYPNPFNPTTSIRYSLKHDSWVTIIIYNILGQEIKRLVEDYRYAGFNTVVWDGNNDCGNNVSSGIYFYKLIAGNFIDQKKMVIIR